MVIFMTALRNFKSITEKNIKICIFIAHYSRIPKTANVRDPHFTDKKAEAWRQ